MIITIRVAGRLAHRPVGENGINRSMDLRIHRPGGSELLVADIFQVAQRAVDLDRACAFYARLLEAEPTGVFDPPGLVFFQVGPVRLLLDRGATASLIYLKVDDVKATVERLRADGVMIVSEPHVIFSHADDTLGPAGTDEWMAFFTDSEGNTVGLVSHAVAGSG